MEEDAIDPELARAVRAQFPDIPDDVFSEAPVTQWIDMLSFETQMKLVESVSLKHEPETTTTTLLSPTLTKMPLDLWGYMLKDMNNSSLRALCRADRWFHQNCPRILKKIGVLRHGNAYAKSTWGDAEKYPVETLIAFEATKVYFQNTLDCRFVFKRGPEIVVEISREAIYARRNHSLSIPVMVAVFNEFFSVHMDAGLAVAAPMSFIYLQDMDAWKRAGPRDMFRLFFLMLTTHQLHLYRVIAEEEFETPSKKDGKPFIHHGQRDMDTTRITSCIPPLQ
jgi:hypothetical protein